MACNNCNDPKRLNQCGDCQYILDTDCIIYNGAPLGIEEDSVKEGSSRTLTDILLQIPDESCCTRLSKEVEGNYTIVEEDIQKLLLLNGDTDTESDNVNNTYTIILPEDEAFIGKTLIFKDISEKTSGDPGGRIVWNFDTAVQYRWDTATTSTSFDTLISWDYALHRTLYLTYVKIGINYQWIVINEAHKDVTKTEITDGEMDNDWVTDGAGAVKVCKQGNLITLEGYVSGGTSGSSAFTLPVSHRPSVTATFITSYDDTPYFTSILISSSGVVTISTPGVGGTVSSAVSLWGINFLID